MCFWVDCDWFLFFNLNACDGLFLFVWGQIALCCFAANVLMFVLGLFRAY